MPSMAMETSAATQNSPLLKQLASSNSKTRQDALETLKLYLSRQGAFEEIELLKMWKGLFYTMWMCDKARNQQQLATELANMVDNTLATVNVFPFLDAFWQTMAREWSGIDALRMDKYLLLIRRYLAASFRFLSRPANRWSDDSAVTNYVAILSATPLNTHDQRIPNGLRYHVLDIYIDELDKIDRVPSAGTYRRSGNMPLEELLQPLQALRTGSPTKSVRSRALEVLGDRRLEAWDKVDDEEDEGPGVTAASAEDPNSHDMAASDD